MGTDAVRGELRRLGCYRVDEKDGPNPEPAVPLPGEALAQLWGALIFACVGETGRREAMAKELDALQRAGKAVGSSLGHARYSSKIQIKSTEAVIALIHQVLVPDAPFLCDDTCSHLARGATPSEVKRILDSLDWEILRIRETNKRTQPDHPCYEDELDELSVYGHWRGALARLAFGDSLPPIRETPPGEPPPGVSLYEFRRSANARALAAAVARLPVKPSPDEARPPGEVGVLRVPANRIQTILQRVGRIDVVVPEVPDAFLQGRTESPHELPGAFDPNLMLKAFPAVRLREGLVLDYVWRGDEHHGSPLLYSRRMDERPIHTVAEFSRRFGVTPEGYAPQFPQTWLPALEIETSVLAAVQFAVLLNELPNFYWHWHAAYERVELTQTIASRKRRLSEFLPADVSKVLACNPEVVVRWADSRRWVSMVVYRDNDGFLLRTWELELPPRLVSITDAPIAEPQFQKMY